MRLIVAASCLLLAACGSAPQAPAPAEPPPAPVEAIEPVEPVAEPSPPEPPPPPAHVSFAMVGDMMIGTDFPENRLPDDDAVGFLADVTPFLASVDVAIGNLEGVLKVGGEPGKPCSNPRACWLFRSPPRYAERFRAAGFDLLSLANNHARDFGEEGRDASMAALASVGIRHSGRDGTTTSLEVNGVSIGFIAFAVTKNSNMLLDYELSEMRVRALASMYDILVVSFHGGAEGVDHTRLPFAEEEYYNEPRGDVVYFARTMIDAGADLVFGHGPHIVRAMERYKGRLIAYSLGNFATYYGISVSGIKGVAPIVLATLDETGEFIDGEIVSTRQIRPAGPTLDPNGRALRQLRVLSQQDFGNSGLRFDSDGRLVAIPRPDPEPHELQLTDP
ncbi:MAG: CapA family protein [Pseudomonadota bacterium]